MTPVTGHDYVAPLNVVSQYRVLAYSQSVLVAATSPSNVRSVTPYGDEHWLKHPANPLLNTVLPVAAPKAGEGIKVIKRRMQGTFQLLGGGAGSTVLPVVVSGPAYGDEYELDLIFHGDQPVDYWPAVDQLDRSGSPLLFQRPNGDQLWVTIGPGAAGRDTEETYNAPPGNPRRVQWRRRKITLTQVDPPSYY